MGIDSLKTESGIMLILEILNFSISPFLAQLHANAELIRVGNFILEWLSESQKVEPGLISILKFSVDST